MTTVETTSDDAERSKPHPDIFNAALERLKVPAERAIVVGDTPFDVEAAKKTGIRTTGLLRVWPRPPSSTLLTCIYAGLRRISAYLWDRWRNPEGDDVLSATIIVSGASAWMDALPGPHAGAAAADVSTWLDTRAEGAATGRLKCVAGMAVLSRFAAPGVASVPATSSFCRSRRFCPARPLF